MLKKLSMVGFTVIFLARLAGCSQEKDAYTKILQVNEEEYIWHGTVKNGEFTQGERLGNDLSIELTRKLPQQIKAYIFTEVQK